MALLIASVISIFKHEISEFTFAAHNTKDEDLFLGATVEYTTGPTDHLAITLASNFRRNLTGSGVPLKALDGGEHSLHQLTCRWSIFQRDVFCYLI